jgi:FkbM family methyltransferase
MSQRLKTAIKRRLTRLACRYLQLYTDPPQLVSDMGNPIGLIKLLGLECRSVIHVGANIGQEFESYRRAGLESAVYVEPIPEIFAKLQARVSVDKRHHAINALCTDRVGDEVEFHVASNNGESSSILELGSHAVKHPEVGYVRTLKLRTTTLDHLIFETPSLDPRPFDCLVLDVQGAEAKVLAGAEQTLRQCRFVFAEVNDGGLYKGDATSEEIINMLKVRGFVLRSLDINRYGWGNAFFVKA